MSTTIVRRTISAALIITGILGAQAALAAPPQKVTYHGKAVTTGVIGKSVTLKFRVKNTSDVAYSGVRVTFHVPSGLTSTKVAPNDAVISDDLIYWDNVPLEAGKSFYPTLTFKVDSDTPLKKKLNIWVEVTGTDMEATSSNFSVTTTAKK